MSIKLYDLDGVDSPAKKRKIAVEVALDLIHADCIRGSSDRLIYHLDNLPDYVDKIQNALKAEGDSFE